MKAAIITFPGSNCDRDLRVAFASAGAEAVAVWHKDNALPDGTDLVAIPGGFSYGDYLRCGAIAAHSPIASAIRAHSDRGGYVLWKPGCIYCERLLRQLGDDTRVQWVNVRCDDVANDEVRSYNDGNELTPTAVVGDVVLSNPSAEQLKVALKARA